MKEKAVIFDLDGTLLNSLTDIAICANKVLKEFNLPTHKIEEYKNFVGGGASILVKNCLPKDSNKELKNSVLIRFKEVYNGNLFNNTKPYKGINELLYELKKREIKIGILSNKPHKSTLKCIKHFFNDFNILEIHGQKDNIPKKPDPTAAIDIATKFNYNPNDKYPPQPTAAIDIATKFNIPCEKIYFVGDSNIDMKTAKNAKMKAVGVRWGFRGVKELIENGADFIVETPKDILKLLE